MVFFSCNACGDSVKKNQVEKHIFRCRQCTVLSCIDCCKEFHGEEYRNHVTCITEEAKYSGKNFKPKENANKGEKKQGGWLESIRRNIAAADVKNQLLKEVLERMATYNNIPRAQKKFENFVKQCLSLKNDTLVKEAWNIISKVSEDTKKPTKEDHSAKSEEAEDEAQKISKRKRKEARQKQAKVEKKDAKEALLTPVAEAEPHEGKKQSRKRKRNHEINGKDAGASTNGHDAEEVQADDKKSAKKRKKNKHEELETEEEQNGHDSEEAQAEDKRAAKKKRKNKQKDLKTAESQEEQPDAPSKPEKFQWTEVVKSLLEAADENELTLKRLKKKVVAEYSSRGYCKPTTKEELEAKLLKRVQKNPLFKLHKERVKLVL